MDTERASKALDLANRTQLNRLLITLERPLDQVFVEDRSLVKKLKRFFCSSTLNDEVPIMIIGGFGGSGKTKHLSELIKNDKKEGNNWWIAHHIPVDKSVLDDVRPEIHWARLISSIKNKIEQADSTSIFDRYRRLRRMPLLFRLRHLVRPRLRSVDYIQRFLRADNTDNQLIAYLRKRFAAVSTIRTWLAASFAAMASPAITGLIAKATSFDPSAYPPVATLIEYQNWIAFSAVTIAVILVTKNILRIRRALLLQGLTLGNPLRADLYHDVAARSQDVHRVLLKAIIADLAVAAKSWRSTPFITTIILDFEQIPDYVVDGHEIRGMIQDLDQFYRERLIPFLSDKEYILSPRLVLASKVWRYGLRELPSLTLATVPEFSHSEVSKYFISAANIVVNQINLPPTLRSNAASIIDEAARINIPHTNMIANEVRLLCQARLAGQNLREGVLRAAELTRRRHLNLRYADRQVEYEDDRLIKSMQIAAIMPWVREDEYEKIRTGGCTAEMLPYHQLRRQVGHLIVCEDDSPCISQRLGFELHSTVRNSFISGNYAACCSHAYTALFARLTDSTSSRSDSTHAQTISELEGVLAAGLPGFRVACFYPQSKWIKNAAFFDFLGIVLSFADQADVTRRPVKRILSDCLDSLASFYSVDDREFLNEYELEEIDVDLADVSSAIHQRSLAILIILSNLLRNNEAPDPDIENAVLVASSYSEQACSALIMEVISELSKGQASAPQQRVKSTTDVRALMIGLLWQVGAWNRSELQTAGIDLCRNLAIEIEQYAKAHSPKGRILLHLERRARSLFNSSSFRESSDTSYEDVEPTALSEEAPVSQHNVPEQHPSATAGVIFSRKEADHVRNWLESAEGVEKKSLTEALRIVISGIILGEKVENIPLEERDLLDKKVSLLESLLVDIFLRGNASDRAALLQVLVSILSKYKKGGNLEYLFRKSMLLQQAWSTELRIAEEPSRRLVSEVRCWLVLIGAVRPRRMQTLVSMEKALSGYLNSSKHPFEYSIALTRYEFLISSLLGIEEGIRDEHSSWRDVAINSLQNNAEITSIYNSAWAASWGIQSCSKRVLMGEAMVALARTIARTESLLLQDCYDWAKKGLTLALSNGTDQAEVWEVCARGVEELERTLRIKGDGQFWLLRVYRQHKKAFRRGALQIHHNKIRFIGAVSWARDDERPRLRSIRIAAFAVARYLPAVTRADDMVAADLLADYAIRVIARLVEHYRGRIGQVNIGYSQIDLFPDEKVALERFAACRPDEENVFSALFELLSKIIEVRKERYGLTLQSGDMTFARIVSISNGRVEMSVAGHDGKVLAISDVDERIGNMTKLPATVWRAANQNEAIPRECRLIIPVVVRRQGHSAELLPISGRGLRFCLQVLNLIYPTASEAEALHAPVVRTRIDAHGSEIDVRRTAVFLGASNTWIAWRVDPEDLGWLLAGGGWFIRHLQSALHMRRITLFPKSPDRTREGIAREIKHFINNSYRSLRIELIGRKVAAKNWEDRDRKNRTFQSMFRKVFDREIESV